MAAEDYKFDTARAVCNDAVNNTWHVEAIRKSDGRYWVISDSSEMSEDQAEAEANQTRLNREFCSDGEE